MVNLKIVRDKEKLYLIYKDRFDALYIKNIEYVDLNKNDFPIFDLLLTENDFKKLIEKK